MRISTLLLLLYMPVFLSAQNTKIKVIKGLTLTNDAVLDTLLVSNTNDFLNAAQLPNESNKFVLPAQKIETYILLDEILGITTNQNSRETNFYKAHIINCIEVEVAQYLLQVAYLSTSDSIPQLNAIFEIIAHKGSNGFLFSSPLKYNTLNWKIFTEQNTTVYFKTDIQKNKVLDYTTFAGTIDAKLKSTDKSTEFYCCDNFNEVLKLIGVLYKAEYAGIQLNTLASVADNKKLIVAGEHSNEFTDFDKHDLWHDRLSLVVPRNTLNKPVDEGCAYLYGGSWGLSWNEIFTQFIKSIPITEQTDWKEYKENPFNFGENDTNHLYVDYVINALIVQQLEKQYGFEAVWKLLNSGKFQKGNENYYAILKEIAGVDSANYNARVYGLINNKINNK